MRFSGAQGYYELSSRLWDVMVIFEDDIENCAVEGSECLARDYECNGFQNCIRLYVVPLASINDDTEDICKWLSLSARDLMVKNPLEKIGR